MIKFHIEPLPPSSLSKKEKKTPVNKDKRNTLKAKLTLVSSVPGLQILTTERTKAENDVLS